MTCEQALEFLSGHLDGQNTPEEEAALLQHLEDCPSCQAILQAYEAADQGIAQLELEPPAELLTGVMTRIHADGNNAVQPKKRRFFFGPGTAIAAVAAVLLLILGTGDLKNLSAGKASTAEANPQAGDVAPRSVELQGADANVATLPEPAAFEAPLQGDPQSPKVNAELVTPKAAARGAAGQTDGETDMIDGVPHLIITENAEKPVLDSIASLKGLETVTDDAGGVWYVADAKTARTIQAEFADDYEMEPYLLGEETEDIAVCVITVQ